MRDVNVAYGRFNADGVVRRGTATLPIAITEALAWVACADSAEAARAAFAGACEERQRRNENIQKKQKQKQYVSGTAPCFNNVVVYIACVVMVTVLPGSITEQDRLRAAGGKRRATGPHR